MPLYYPNLPKYYKISVYIKSGEVWSNQNLLESGSASSQNPMLTDWVSRDVNAAILL
jgi:hypothetical protein